MKGDDSVQSEKKKRLMLIILAIVAIVIVLIVALVIANNNLFKNGENLEIENEEIVENENEKENETTNEGVYIYLQGTKKVGDVEFKNIRIKKIERSKCEFLADVENKTEEHLKPQDVTIKVIDDSGEVDEIFAGILTELAPYEPNKFKTQVLSDITDVIDVEIEVKER